MTDSRYLSAHFLLLQREISRGRHADNRSQHQREGDTVHLHKLLPCIRLRDGVDLMRPACTPLVSMSCAVRVSSGSVVSSTLPRVGSIPNVACTRPAASCAFAMAS